MDANRLTYCTERLDDVTNRLAPLIRHLEAQPKETDLVHHTLQLCYAITDLVEAITGLRDSESSG